MDTSTITLIVLLITLIFYFSNILPLHVTTLLAMLAMIFSGILAPAEAFSGFANTATLTVAGMMVMGEAFAYTGLSDKIGQTIGGFGHMKEKWFNVMVFLINALLSALLNSVVLMAIFMPVLDTIAAGSNGRITRRGAYLPAAIGGVVGAMLSTIGATSGIHGFGLFETNEYVISCGRTVGFFEPAVLGIPAVGAALIFYMTIGTRLQRKWFDFEEPASVRTEKIVEVSADMSKKQKITLAVTGICAALWMSGLLNIAAVAMAGSCALMILKCVDEKTVFKQIDWNTIIIVGGSVGFARGIESSGAALKIANAFLSIGKLSESPLGSCVLLLIVGCVISNFMSNTAAVTIIVPIAILIAKNFGGDPFPYALSAIVGCSLGLSTPICTSTITMTVGAGYRPKDFFRIGTIVSLMAILFCTVTLKIVYFI